LTRLGLEPSTFRLVALCINHCVNSYPYLCRTVRNRDNFTYIKANRQLRAPASLTPTVYFLRDWFGPIVGLNVIKDLLESNTDYWARNNPIHPGVANQTLRTCAVAAPNGIYRNATVVRSYCPIIRNPWQDFVARSRYTRIYRIRARPMPSREYMILSVPYREKPPVAHLL
jgi:hypothetical protein